MDFFDHLWHGDPANLTRWANEQAAGRTAEWFFELKEKGLSMDQIQIEMDLDEGWMKVLRSAPSDFDGTYKLFLRYMNKGKI